MPLVFGLLLFVLILLFIKDKPKAASHIDASTEAHALNYRQLLDYLKLMVKNPQMWLIGVVGALLYLPSSVFLDVWAIPYLRAVHHLTAEQAALGVSVMLTGWICSSFCSCAISDIIGSRKAPLVLACFCGFLIASVILFVHALPVSVLYALLVVFGFCCGPHPLCFTLSKENNAHKISGTAVAFANCIIMMGGFVFQPIVGKTLDWLWNGKMEGGIQIYSSQHYTMALSILPIGLLLAGILTLFLKETYQRKCSD